MLFRKAIVLVALLAAPVYAAQVIECTDEALHTAIADIETNCLTYTAAEKTIEFNCVGGTVIDVEEDIGDRSQDLDCDNAIGNDSWTTCGSGNCVIGCSTCAPAGAAGLPVEQDECTRPEYSWLTDRELNCDGMTIDGEGTAGGRVVFALVPGCNDRPGFTHADTNTDNQSGLFRIAADDITVKNLEYDYFFEGIQIRPDPERGQTADNATLDNIVSVRTCEEAVTAAVAPGGREWIVDKTSLVASDTGPGTESSPFLSPAGCIAKMKGGDTCSIKGPGPYVATGQTAHYIPKWDFCSCDNECNGTEDAPTIIRAYPGHKPKFCVNSNCDATVPTYFKAAIGGYQPNGSTCEWLVFDGLHVDGSMKLKGEAIAPPFLLKSIVVKNMEFEGGGDYDSCGADGLCGQNNDTPPACANADFNQAMLHIDGFDGVQVIDSYFHNHAANPCNNRMSHIVGFEGEDLLLQNNEHDSRSGPGGFYAWYDAHRNNQDRVNIKFNWARGKGMFDIGGPETCTEQNQENCPAAHLDNGSDSHVIGNRITESGAVWGGSTRSRITMGRCEDCSIEWNTIVDSPDAIWVTQEPVTNLVVRNNVVHGLIAGGEKTFGPAYNVITGWDSPSGPSPQVHPTPDLSSTSWDYNRYDVTAFAPPEAGVVAGKWRADLYFSNEAAETDDTLGEWQTRLGGGCSGAVGNECNSSTTACTFVDAEYRVSGACATAAHDGGELGWEGATDCVGRFCNQTEAYRLDDISISDASFERGSGTCVSLSNLVEASSTLAPNYNATIADSAFEDCSTPLNVQDGRVLLDGNTISDTADAGAIACQHIQLGTTGIEGNNPAVYAIDNTSSGCMRAFVVDGYADLQSNGGNQISGKVAGITCKDQGRLSLAGGLTGDTIFDSGTTTAALSLGLGGVSIQDGCVAALGGGMIEIDDKHRSPIGNNVLYGNVSTKHCLAGDFTGFPCNADGDCPPASTCVAGSVDADLVDRRPGADTMAKISAENNQWGETESLGANDVDTVVFGQPHATDASIDWDPVCDEVPCGVAPTVPAVRFKSVRLTNVRISEN